jgi:hypothetical protein
MQAGRLVKELARKAELVGEGAQWGATHTTAPKPKRFDRTACLQRPQSEKALNQPQSLQARVAVLADDQMIMHGNFQGFAHRDDLMGEVDVVGRRPWIAGWMIVHKDDRRSAEFEGGA